MTEPGRRAARSLLIVEQRAHTGAWNMSLDEAALEAALESLVDCVRVYRWSEPTVSLGYFQQAAEIENHPVFSHLSAVRRLSGGGAILHHHEWTYSIALHPGHPACDDPLALYGRVHAAIGEVVARYGGSCHPRGTALRREQEPFLCFGRGDPRDLICGPHKVLGSAQRRRRGGLLQHGSLLMARSEHAPQFPGLCDLQPGFVPEESFAGQLGRAIADTVLQTDSIQPAAPEALQQRASELERRKYAHLSWSRELIREA